MSQSHDRQAVYLVRGPADWKPDRPWHRPPVILSGRLLKSNLSLHDATTFARVHGT